MDQKRTWGLLIDFSPSIDGEHSGRFVLNHSLDLDESETINGWLGIKREPILLTAEGVWFGSYEESDAERLVRLQRRVKRIANGVESYLISGDLSLATSMTEIVFDKSVKLRQIRVTVEWTIDTYAEHPDFYTSFQQIEFAQRDAIASSKQRLTDIAKNLMLDSRDVLSLQCGKSRTEMVLVLENRSGGTLWMESPTPVPSRGELLYSRQGSTIGRISETQE